MKRSDKKNHIANEQVRLLYSGSIVTILVSIFASFILCWSQYSEIAHSTLYLWFTLFVLISLSRITLVYFFHRKIDEDTDLHLWRRYFLIGVYIAAIFWGMSSFLLFPVESQQSQGIFCLIILGVSAGSISSLYPDRQAAIAFISLVLLPLALRLLSLGVERSIFTGILILIFYVVVLVGVRKLSATISNNIMLKLESISREKELRASEERYRKVINNAPLGILQYDAAGNIIDSNKYLVNLLGSSREKLLNFNLLTMLEKKEMLHAVKDSLDMGNGYFEGDYTSVTGSGDTSIRAFFQGLRGSDSSIIGGVGIVEDFTDKKRYEDKIHYHASYDFLTGLANRRLLRDKLSEEISRAKRHDSIGALLFIDLDNFKIINDTLGHAAGDSLLQVLASRIKKSIRKEDSAARVGGDEFVIILTELEGTMETAAKKAQIAAEKILTILTGQCLISGKEIHPGLSIGVSLFPKAAMEAEDILKQADTAMYQAKKDQRGSIRFYSPEVQKMAEKRLRLKVEIKAALNNDEFVLYYQPQIDNKGYLVGAEGLIRWEQPERGLVPPGVFLEIAEETGLMPDIGRWVLHTACQKIKKWSDEGILAPTTTLSINISGKELAEKNFVDTVGSILDSSGANPLNLGIELTEGSLISTSHDIVSRILALKKLGIKFSIDDFGTGYSSLNYLNKLPINTLKIDRSFINDISDTQIPVVLVDTIIMMAENLGLKTIAEGVESKIELDYLVSKGCTVFQGYYFSKPLPEDDFVEMLSSAHQGPLFKDG